MNDPSETTHGSNESRSARESRSKTVPVPGLPKAGFHHNTKEYDVNVEMVYMYQRWYSAELGVFASRAPMPRTMEHPYSFALQMPNIFTDPLGMCFLSAIGNAIGSAADAVGGAAVDGLEFAGGAVVDGGAFVAGNVWAAPNTAIATAHGVAGVVVAPVTVLGGGKFSYPIIDISHGIQFINNPLMPPYSAFNPGSPIVASYGTDLKPDEPFSGYSGLGNMDAEDHEKGHGKQGAILGPKFLILYMIKPSEMEADADYYGRNGELTNLCY